MKTPLHSFVRILYWAILATLTASFFNLPWTWTISVITGLTIIIFIIKGCLKEVLACMLPLLFIMAVFLVKIPFHLVAAGPALLWLGILTVIISSATATMFSLLLKKVYRRPLKKDEDAPPEFKRHEIT